MLGKNFIRRHFEIFFPRKQKIGFDISCKLSICMKYQSLFSGKKNILESSADFAARMVKMFFSCLDIHHTKAKCKSDKHVIALFV